MRHLGKAALIVALATGLAAAGASAQAQTPPAAKKAAAAPKAARTKPANVTEVCETDIAIFCGDLERKGARTTKCLKDNVAIVSTECAAAVGGGSGSGSAKKKK